MPSVKRGEIVVARGEGAYLWDEDGNRYLDTPAGLWYCNVGHGRKEIADAVARQLSTLETYHTFQQFANRPALDLAARVAELAPIPNAKVFLTSGGSDAIDAAAKLARRYWSALGRPSKRTIVTRERAYHGLHAFGTSIIGLDINREGFGDLVPETARVPTNDAAALGTLINEFGADSVAAFFAEPIVGTGGVIHPAPGYFDEVQRICREHDVLFVADEVITGFGRTGELFATQRFGLEPDLMIMAKGITSGYLPLGGVVVDERIWTPFWEDESELVFRHGLTYAGHASVCAAAMANLDILEREELVARGACSSRCSRERCARSRITSSSPRCERVSACSQASSSTTPRWPSGLRPGCSPAASSAARSPTGSSTSLRPSSSARTIWRCSQRSSPTRSTTRRLRPVARPARFSHARPGGRPRAPRLERRERLPPSRSGPAVLDGAGGRAVHARVQRPEARRVAIAVKRGAQEGADQPRPGERRLVEQPAQPFESLEASRHLGVLRPLDLSLVIRARVDRLDPGGPVGGDEHRKAASRPRPRARRCRRAERAGGPAARLPRPPSRRARAGSEPRA